MNSVNKKDPCPCGSGKIYKRCCLRNVPKLDKAAAAKLLDCEKQLNAIVESPIQPYTTDKDIFSKYQKSMAEIKRYLSSDEVDDSGIFEIFNDFYYHDACDTNQFDDFFTLIEQVRTQYPDIYREEGQYLAMHAIDANFRQERYSEAQEWFLKYAKLCDGHLEFFGPELDRIVLYNFLDTALQGIKTIWPDIINKDFFLGAKRELRQKYFNILCYHEYLNSNGEITRDEILKKASGFELEEDAKEFKTDPERYNWKFLEILLASKDTLTFDQLETNIEILKKDKDSGLLKENTTRLLSAFFSDLMANNALPAETGLFCYFFHVTEYAYERINGSLVNPNKLTHPYFPEITTLKIYIADELDSPLQIFSFLRAILLWTQFLFEHNLIEHSPLPFLKECTILFVEQYNLIAIENASQAIKAKAKEILTILQQMIQKHENNPTTH